MTHPGHNVTHCVHGTIVSQCRCAIKDKPSLVVECPKNCDARRVHLAGSDEVVGRVEKQIYAMRNDGWDLRPFTDLAAEVRELRRDRARLDWLERERATVWPMRTHFGVEYVRNDDGIVEAAKTLRGAIDAAMGGGEGDA